jgi:hypothetical protein
MTRSTLLVTFLSFSILTGCGASPAGKEGGTDPTRKEAGTDPKGEAVDLQAALARAETILQKTKGFSLFKDESGRHAYFIMFGTAGNDQDLLDLRRALGDAPIAIELSLGEITDAGLAHLKDWKRLSILQLSANKITEAGLSNLAALSNLEELTIANAGLTDADLAPIGKLTNLRRLSCISDKITSAGYAQISGLTKLAELQVGGIGYYIGDSELRHMKNMSQLRKLNVGGKGFSDEGLAQLKYFPELRELSIVGPPLGTGELTSTAFQNLSHLKKLEMLILTQCYALGKDPGVLKGLKGVTRPGVSVLRRNAGSCGGIEKNTAQHENTGRLSRREDSFERRPACGGVARPEALRRAC